MHYRKMLVKYGVGERCNQVVGIRTTTFIFTKILYQSLRDTMISTFECKLPHYKDSENSSYLAGGNAYSPPPDPKILPKYVIELKALNHSYAIARMQKNGKIVSHFEVLTDVDSLAINV